VVRRLAAPTIGLAIGCGVVALRAPGWLSAFELQAYDVMLRLRASAHGPDPRIAIVLVGEAEIRELGYPLPDAVLADALRELLDAGATAVGVDLYRDRSVGDAGSVRLGAVAGDARVVMIEKVGEAAAEGVPAPAYLRDDQVGFSDCLTDADGVVRRGLLYLWDADGRVHVSLSLQLARRYLALRGVAVGPDPDDPAVVRVGETPLPFFRGNDGGYRGAEDSGYQFLLDFRSAPAPFSSVPFAGVAAGDFDRDAVRARVVLIGTVSPSVTDRFELPVRVAGRDTSAVGVEVHAHGTSQLLRAGLLGARPTRSPSELVEAFWMLAFGLAGAQLGWRLRRPLVLAAALAGGAALLASVCIAAFLLDWWIPAVSPALAAVGAAFASLAFATREEHAERNLVMDLFARNVGRRVAERLWEQREQFMEDGRPRAQRLTLTVLMADLKGYMAVSEQMDPAVLMEWVNAFMAAMAQLVEQHGGAVDDYAGDGIKANFGAPIPRGSEEEVAGDARNAVACALAMGEQMEQLNRRWREQDLPTAKMRVGIHTGPAVVGSLGSARRLKFTSVGDTVNTASRLESFDKEGFERDPSARSCRILIDESTLRLVEGLFEVEPVGHHELPGREGKVSIYRVLGRTGR